MIVFHLARAWTAGGAEVVHSVEEALASAGDDVAVIGGAEVFALFRDRADRVELTEVHCDAVGDVRMPGFADWREVAREDVAAEGGRPAYSFVTLVRG
jgi:dihydrofolate reductase